MAVCKREQENKLLGLLTVARYNPFRFPDVRPLWMIEEQIWNLFEKTQTHKSMSFGSWQIDDMAFSVAGVTKLKILTWWGPRLEVEKRPQKPELQWQSLQDVLTIF